MGRHTTRATRLLITCGLAAMVSGCAQIDKMARHLGLKESPPDSQEISRFATLPTQPQLVARDRPAPEAFEMTARAIWDGEPTFGKIWIAVPGVEQPERVLIRNDATGQMVRGGMLVASSKVTGPIRLSSGAAMALGIEKNSPANITVTALRREAAEPREVAQPVQIAQIPELDLRIFEDPLPAMEVSEAPREMAITPPTLFPATTGEERYVEVAQSYTADNAVQVQNELARANIQAEIQEDFVGGQAYYRVFAPEGGRPDLLYDTLADVELASGYEGSDDGTVIAEMPPAPEPLTSEETWVEFAAYPSFNEAQAMKQRLSRRDIPTEICSGRQGLLEVHRVFAGPAGDGAVDLEDMAFCAGVAAADAARPKPKIRAVMSSPIVSVKPVQGAAEVTGPVRIKVGESTGGLKIDIPNKFSEVHRIEVAGITVTVPAVASPELVARIRAALARIEATPP